MRRLAICGALAVVGWAVAVVCTPFYCEWYCRRTAG